MNSSRARTGAKAIAALSTAILMATSALPAAAATAPDLADVQYHRADFYLPLELDYLPDDFEPLIGYESETLESDSLGLDTLDSDSLDSDTLDSDSLDSDALEYSPDDAFNSELDAIEFSVGSDSILPFNAPGQIARNIGPNPPTGGRIQPVGPVLTSQTTRFEITQPFIDGVTGQPIPMANIGFIYDWGGGRNNYFTLFNNAFNPTLCASRVITTDNVRCNFSPHGPGGSWETHFYLRPTFDRLFTNVNHTAALDARIGMVAFGSNGSARIVWSDPIIAQSQQMQITNFRIDHLPPSGADFRVHFSTSQPFNWDPANPYTARILVQPVWPQSPAPNTANIPQMCFWQHFVAPNSPTNFNPGSMSANRMNFWCDFYDRWGTFANHANSIGASGLPTGIRISIQDLPGIVTAHPTTNISHPLFRDVLDNHPHWPYISWLADTGITTGFDNRTFRPDQAVNRAAMAAFLFRAAGSPAFTPPTNPTFSDVPRTHNFFGEIEWLASTGITTGWAEPNGTRTFRPGQPITRAAMSAFLHRFHGNPAVGGQSNFRDVPADHQFARYIGWMATNSITTGWDDGTFRPDQPVTRGAMAAFMARTRQLGSWRWNVPQPPRQPIWRTMDVELPGYLTLDS